MKKLTYLMIGFLALLMASSGCSKKEDSNQNPEVSSVQVNPSSVTVNGMASISVSASDANGDELSYDYFVSGGSISGSGSSVSWNAPANGGVFTVEVTVSDGKGEATGSGQLTVLAPVNNNPVISSIQLNPTAANPGQVVSISVLANDADGDQLTYQYQVNGGAVSGSGPSVSWTAPSQAGSYSVTVTVMDGEGGQAVSNGSITVSQPVTKITGTASFPAGSSGDLSNAKVSIYTSYDNWNNNNPLQYIAANGSGSNVSFELTNVTPGIYYLDVWKDNDNSGGWSFGDFVGWYGDGGLGAPSLTEISVQGGQTTNVSITMMTITGKQPGGNTKVNR
ncbi:MAG: PKD domain-containing protein [Bacteroidetes bacterium]|nr:PKD domain-containing protein [Bacteroidota bacterium]